MRYPSIDLSSLLLFAIDSDMEPIQHYQVDLECHSCWPTSHMTLSETSLSKLAHLHDEWATVDRVDDDVAAGKGEVRPGSERPVGIVSKDIPKSPDEALTSQQHHRPPHHHHQGRRRRTQSPQRYRQSRLQG